MNKRTATGLLFMAALTGAAWAQDDSPRDTLIDLATIEAVHTLCQFDLSDAQGEAITRTRGRMIDDGEVTDSDVSSIGSEIAASLARQVPEGLCKPNGAEAQLYRRKVAELDGG